MSYSNDGWARGTSHHVIQPGEHPMPCPVVQILRLSRIPLSSGVSHFFFFSPLLLRSSKLKNLPAAVLHVCIARHFFCPTGRCALSPLIIPTGDTREVTFCPPPRAG